MSKKKILFNALLAADAVAGAYRHAKKVAKLEDSLRRMSGVVAQVEAFYQKNAAITGSVPPRGPYEEGYRDGMNLMLDNLSGILHPEGQDDVYYLFDPAIIGLSDESDEDCPDFVEKGGDRG